MVKCKWVIILTLHHVTGLSWIQRPAFSRQPRHVIGRVHTHGPGDSHDTGAAIQTILSSLGKQNNETEFTCEEEGAFPHPLLCTKYYLCEEDLEVIYKLAITLKCQQFFSQGNMSVFTTSQASCLMPSPGLVYGPPRRNVSLKRIHFSKQLRPSMNLTLTAKGMEEFRIPIIA